MLKTAVVFDFDGTIADSIPHILRAMNELAPTYGYPPLTNEEFESLRQYSLHDLIKKFKIPFYKLPFLISKLRKTITGRMHQMGLCKGMNELIRQLDERGYTLGIVSSSPLPNIKFFLDKQGLYMFDFVESQLNLFGKGKTIESILKKKGIVKSEAIYIGDEMRDIEACRSIGLDVIGVTWGFNNEEGLRKSGASLIAQKPQEIIELIK